VVVAGEGRAPEMIPLVVVAVAVAVVDETSCMMVVVVMARGMMIHILIIQMVLDPGQLLKAMSNRVQNLYLSEVLLPY